MRDTMGIIITNDEKIPPVTDVRAIAALPIAGRYRVIDFVLSNMANAGLTNIGVATETNYSSLMDHIKSGKPWDLDRKNEGLNILPPNLANLSYGGVRGDIDMLQGISDFIRRSRQTYVIPQREAVNAGFLQFLVDRLGHTPPVGGVLAVGDHQADIRREPLHIIKHHVPPGPSDNVADT